MSAGAGKRIQMTKLLSPIEALEQENKEMEDRLRQFRETMQRQKEKRIFLNGNSSTLWKGGQTGIGSLSSYASDVLTKRKNKGFKGVGKEGFHSLIRAESIIKTEVGANLTKSLSASNPLHTARSKAVLAPVGSTMPGPMPPQSLATDASQGSSSGQLVPIPPPAEKEKPPRPKSTRMWRVPQEIRTVIHTKEEPEPYPNSLLDGEYDPEESRNSFLEALNDWRKGVSRAPTPKRDIQTSEYQQTVPVKEAEISINFQENLSYLDKLVLQNRKRPINEPAPKPIAISEPEPVNENETIENNDEWDESDHENFIAIIQSLRNKQNINDETEIPDLGEFSVEDVTECEEEVILEALDKGIMIECVPCSKCVVVEPEDI